MCMYVGMHACMHACMYVYVCMCMYIWPAEVRLGPEGAVSLAPALAAMQKLTSLDLGGTDLSRCTVACCARHAYCMLW